MSRFPILNLARVILIASTASAQMYAPGSVNWKQVDFSECGDFPANGRSIKISQIERSQDPPFQPIDPKLLAYRRMGDKEDPFDPLAVQKLKPVGEKCWPVEMWRDAFEVFSVYCTKCHDGSNPGKLEYHGGLDMRTRMSMIIGGRSGPALKPGSALGSLLYQRMLPVQTAVRAASQVNIPLQEPPSGPLPPVHIEAVRVWIVNGAPEPK